MSLRHIFRLPKKVKFAEHGYEVHNFQLPADGLVQYAQWLHPKESAKTMTQFEVDVIRRFVRAGDFVIDIGAHAGDTTVPMAIAAGPKGCTLALEPNRYVYQVLNANAKLNSEKTNIVPKCLAATQEDGQFVFHYSDASFCNGGFLSQQKWSRYRRRHPLEVNGQNLLRLLEAEFSDWLPKLTYVKVDAEGYDRSILESILPILKAYQPVVRTEVYRRLVASERYALFDLLADSGYEMYRYEEGGQESQKLIMERNDFTVEKHFDVWAIPKKKVREVAA